MPDPALPESLDRCRARARRLHQDLSAADPVRSRAAAERFRRLRSFAALGADELIAARDRVQRKHALLVVALELGHESWDALRAAVERAAAAAPMPGMYTAAMAVYLNRWFADHAEARASLAERGGYLLPFRDQCFLTDADAVRLLGLDPDDPDWRRIGFDWVRPADAAAHGRLVARRRAAIADGIGPPEPERRTR